MTRRFLCLSCLFIITSSAHRVPWYRIKRRCGLCERDRYEGDPFDEWGMP